MHSFYGNEDICYENQRLKRFLSKAASDLVTETNSTHTKIKTKQTYHS
jgi:hypothetical protein